MRRQVDAEERHRKTPEAGDSRRPVSGFGVKTGPEGPANIKRKRRRRSDRTGTELKILNLSPLWCPFNEVPQTGLDGTGTFSNDEEKVF